MTPQDLEAYRQACVKIDELCLNEEFIRTPADVAYWSDQYSIIYREWQLAKCDREQAWGAAIKRAKNELYTLGEKRPTVADCESGALNDDLYAQAKRREINFEAEKIRLSGMLEALRTKRDMLVSLGANHRAELQQGLCIKEDT